MLREAGEGGLKEGNEKKNSGGGGRWGAESSENIIINLWVMGSAEPSSVSKVVLYQEELPYLRAFKTRLEGG